MFDFLFFMEETPGAKQCNNFLWSRPTILASNRESALGRIVRLAIHQQSNGASLGASHKRGVSVHSLLDLKIREKMSG